MVGICGLNVWHQLRVIAFRAVVLKIICICLVLLLYVMGSYQEDSTWCTVGTLIWISSEPHYVLLPKMVLILGTTIIYEKGWHCSPHRYSNLIIVFCLLSWCYYINRVVSSKNAPAKKANFLFCKCWYSFPSFHLLKYQFLIPPSVFILPLFHLVYLC